jgi:cell division protein FtsB
MSIESLTYADLAGRLGTSREAARSLVRRLRLPRQTANDGAVRVNVDLSDVQYKPVPRRSPRGHRSDFDALKAQIEQLQAEVTKLETEKGAIEAIAAGHRADFERERERSDKLMTNTMTLASVAMSARAKAARLESELTARQSQFWMRPRTRRRATASEQFRPNALPRPEQPIMQLESIPAAAGRVRTFAELAALVMFAALITAFVEYGIPFLAR